MQKKFRDSFERLKKYCEEEGFIGWDPFDGLNSKIFKSIPGIRKSRIIRLAWIQAFKKNPLNLRKILMIKKESNPKGLGLFLNAYCNLYKTSPKEEYLSRIDDLTRMILEGISQGYSGACWGYNFDWQSKAFFQPAGTPTVVASTFIGYALYEAYDILKKKSILEVANSVSSFILNDLNRTYDNDGDFSFSYSPMDHSQVFNATLLGSRMLARTYSYTGEKNLLDEASRSINFCIKQQNENGSWYYSTLSFHRWIDSFHTGFNLECISEYQKYSNDTRFREALGNGFRFYINNFIMDDGRCKYYYDSLYPIDIHSPSQFIVTLCKLGLLEKYHERAERVLNWVIDHMQDRKGFFYYQVKANMVNRIPYIRWAQAWMLYALSEYLKLTES